jgi:hypothetical protein
MPECDRCGGPVQNKNEAGHYREKCCRCIITEAGTGGRPIPGCECGECEQARGERDD